MKCILDDKPLEKVFTLKRTKLHHARWFYSCGDHLYMKFFGSAVPNDKVRELHFINLKGVPLDQIDTIRNEKAEEN